MSEAGTPLLKSRDPHLAGGEKTLYGHPRHKPPLIIKPGVGSSRPAPKQGGMIGIIKT